MTSLEYASDKSRIQLNFKIKLLQKYKTVSVANYKKLHLKCLSDSWIHIWKQLLSGQKHLLKFSMLDLDLLFLCIFMIYYIKSLDFLLLDSFSSKLAYYALSWSSGQNIFRKTRISKDLIHLLFEFRIAKKVKSQLSWK